MVKLHNSACTGDFHFCHLVLLIYKRFHYHVLNAFMFPLPKDYFPIAKSESSDVQFNFVVFFKLTLVSQDHNVYLYSQVNRKIKY